MGSKINLWYTEKIFIDCRVQDLNSKSSPQSQTTLLPQRETIIFCLKYVASFILRIKIRLSVRVVI